MEFNLNQILESTILLEGRKEDVIKKYGEEHKPLIDRLSDSDPSGNNKYLAWMTKTALGLLNKEEDIFSADSIVKLVNDFHNQLARIKNKDIMSYKSVSDLRNAVAEAKKKEEEKKIAKQAKKVYEDNEVVIYAPFTVQASCKYGAGSKWCIAATSGAGGGNTHFDSYSKHSNFYFFINKDMPMTGRDYKYALQWRFDGQAGENEWTWWDAQDSPHDNPPNWVTEPMLDKVREFDPKHKAMKLGAQLQKFISEPVVRDYIKFRDLLSDKEKSKVIDTIIGRGKLDSNTFKTLSADLTPEQKMDFINKFTTGEVSVSDYKQMEDNLTDSEKVELMANNPHILNNYEVMKKLSDHLSYEQKFNLASRLDGKKINNTDSKVLLRRWSMTKDQLNQHNETNFYIFLSTPDTYINRLIKVDPLDPSSYRTINMLKLKLESQPDTSLFGIKTKAGMLDDFLEKSSKDIPQETIEYIKNNTSKIG
jgi:hypothetical protein